MDHMARKSKSRDLLLKICPTGLVRMQYGLALEFRNTNVCSTIGPGNFLITKDVRLAIYISITLKATHFMYTLSMVGRVYLKVHF